jgi:hypothetical protein
MSFAVQLYFDPRSDTAIRSLWEAVASAGVPFPLRDSGNRPHFSAPHLRGDRCSCQHLLPQRVCANALAFSSLYRQFGDFF